MTTRRPVIFGELLFDCFPDGESVLGGAPLNVAWHLAAFGADPLLITSVGDDALGERARSALHDHGFDTAGVQVDSAHPTGAVHVKLEAEGPRYEIPPDAAFDFLRAEALPDITDGAMLYHGSLALRGETSLRSFRALADSTGLPRFVDLNLRAPWWRREELPDILRGAHVVKLNEHELAELELDAAALREHSGAQLVVLTRGADGAELLLPGEHLRTAPTSQPPIQIVDSVGAGDAFASVVLLGLLANWNPSTILRRATGFASGLLGVRGALLHDRSVYAKTLARWQAEPA